MTRIDYLMQDKERVIQFMRQLYAHDFDCQYCPLCTDKGIILGCATSADEDSIECSISDYLDIEDFLLEEIPNEVELEMWELTCGKINKSC